MQSRAHSRFDPDARRDRAALERALTDAGAALRGAAVRCPFHEDRSPSGSIHTDDQGVHRYTCHASSCGFHGDLYDVLKRSGAPEPIAHSAPDRRSAQRPKREAAVYRYEDADGNLLHETVRFEPKGFRQRRPDGSGGHIWNLDGVSLVLYRLRELIDADPAEPVCIVEGEKDADRLASLGLITTCAPMGAGKWQRIAAHASAVLRDRRIVLIPDNDEPGMAHAQDAARSLAPVASEVRVLALPGLAPKGDVSDWLDAGNDAQALRAMLDRAPLWTSAEPPAPARGYTLRRMSDVAPERVRWLWPGRIPRGKLTLWTGHPGLGKSMTTLDIAARLSRGAPFPDGRPSACEGQRPAQTLLLSIEDGVGDTIRARLDAADADCSRICHVDALYDLRRAPDALERAIEEAGDVGLVVIDPLGAFLGGVDSHKDADVRQALAPLARIADRTGAAILAVGHLNKNGAGSAITRANGSIAFAAASRAVFLIEKDRDDRSRRVVLPVKNNLAPDVGGLAYRIVGEDGAARVEWEADEIPFSADEWMEEGADRAVSGSNVGDACDWLERFLSGGARPQLEIRDAAEAAGISRSTLYRAKERLGVRAMRGGFGQGGIWNWELAGASIDTQL